MHKNTDSVAGESYIRKRLEQPLEVVFYLLCSPAYKDQDAFSVKGGGPCLSMSGRVTMPMLWTMIPLVPCQ